MNDDPTSLDRLHDLVTPPPVPWWPPTPGWWIVIGCVLFLFIVFCLRWFIRWQADCYRREALAMLGHPETTPAAWAAILKRCALACWPRPVVASLTGAAWDGFFRRNAGKDTPAEGVAIRIEELAFAKGGAGDLEALENSVRQWIRHHRKEDAP